MTEPATSATATATAIISAGTATAAGLTVFGVATGLHINILIAGLFGGLWAMSYNVPAGVVSRIMFLLGSSTIAGYIAPVAASVLASAAVALIPWWPREVTREAMQYPVAFLIGFLGLRWIGPALMRRAQKLESEH